MIQLDEHIFQVGWNHQLGWFQEKVVNNQGVLDACVFDP